MKGQTYFAHLDRIKNDPRLIDDEKLRLDDVIRGVASEIKAAITPGTAPSLVWALAFHEIGQVVNTIEHLTQTPLSNYAGHARYLRALAAAVPFRCATTGEDPRMQYLLARCEALWLAIAHREMIDLLNHISSEDLRKRHIAATMSLVGAIQLEIKYTEQAESRLRRIYEPFSSEIVLPALGLTIDEICRGFQAIREIVTDRLETSENLMRPMVEKSHEWRDMSSRGISNHEMEARLFGNVDRERICRDFKEGAETVKGLMLFSPSDLEHALAEKASRWLAQFSFVPGEVNRDFTTPFDRDAVRARPFARLPNDQFLLMDLYYCVFAPLHQLPDVFTDSRQRQRLTRRRDRVLEDDSRSLFSDVVKPQLVLERYYLPVGKQGVLAERDLLLMRDGIVLVIESKAKPLRAVSDHHGSIRKIESDVKRAIQHGYDQACSVSDYLSSHGDEIAFWDSEKPDRKELARIRRRDAQELLAIVVLDSYYGLIAADLGPWLQVNRDVGFPWVVDRDTLECILMALGSFEQLAAFLRWRKTLHGVAINEDESVFAGFFCRHGAAPMPESADLVQLDASYADYVEAEYFRRKGVPLELPTETGPPVWCSMQRSGDQITFRMDDRLHDVIDLQTGNRTGDSTEPPTVMNGRELARVERKIETDSRGKPRRNDLCPCGSGRKYKKCCLRRR